MRLLQILFFYLSVSVAFSTSVTKDMTLKVATCEMLQAEISSLQAWSRKMGSTYSVGEIDCQDHCSASGCEINVMPFAPELAFDLHGRYSKQRAPNCWNLSLFGAGLVQSLRYSTPQEFDFYLNSPLCRLKDLTQEEPSPGDIVAIMEPIIYMGRKYMTHVHGYIYLSDELIFSKNGSANESPYAIQPRSNLNEPYLKDKDPRCSELISPKECHFKQFVYECISLDDYLLLTPMTSEEESIEDDLAEVRCLLEKAIKETGVLDFSAEHMELIESVGQIAQARYTRAVALKKKYDPMSFQECKTGEDQGLPTDYSDLDREIVLYSSFLAETEVLYKTLRQEPLLPPGHHDLDQEGVKLFERSMDWTP